MSDVTVKWYEEDVRALLKDVSQEFLLALAFQVEGEAKVNAPVDTGFLRNSSYVNGAGRSTFIPRETEDRSTVSSARAPSDDQEVLVGFGADYAVYVEVKQPYLYPALQKVMEQAAGTIESVGRKHFD